MILVNLVYTIVDSFPTPSTSSCSTSSRRPSPAGSASGTPALGWIYFLIVFLILALVVKVTNRYVFYAGERNS